MSYQTITNLNSEFQNFQLNLNRISLKENYENSEKTNSFSQMLSSYKEPIQDSGNTAQKVENFAEKNENSQNLSKIKNEKENPQKISENEKENSNEIVKSSEKNEKTQDLKNKDNENSFDKIVNKKLKKEDSYFSVKDEKKSVQTKKNQKDAKKVSNQDFIRINQIGNDNLKNIADENAQKIVQNENLRIQNVENKTLQEENSNFAKTVNYFDKADVPESFEIQQNIQKKVLNVAEKEEKNEKSDFKDLLKKSSDAKNDFYLDKNGKITVKDLRNSTEKNENQENLKKSDLKISEFEVSEDGKLTINMELNQNANADVLSLNNQTATSNGSNFQAMLNNQIQNNIPEFVKAGNIILKDNDRGQINLVLHPEDLGNVKINLSLDGKTVSGNIIVTSKEALQVFKDNAETLREAFIKNGFDAANFEVSYNSSGSQSNQNFNSNAQNDENVFFAKKVYSNGDSVTLEENSDYMKTSENYSNYSVNIVA